MSQLYIETRLTTIEEETNTSDLILNSLLNYDYTNISIIVNTISSLDSIDYNNIKGIKIIAADFFDKFNVTINAVNITSNVDSFELHSDDSFNITIGNESEEDSITVKVITYV
jgi:hypothetical protein